MSEPTRKSDRRTGRHPVVPPLPPGRRRSWLLIILVALAFAMLFSTFSNRGTEVIAYSELKEHIRLGHVEEISLSPSRVEAIPIEGAADEDVQTWRAVRVEDDEELVPLIEEMGITLFAREESACGSGLILFWILPLVFLLIFWGAMLRRMGGGAGTHALSFGKAKFKLYVEEDIGVTFGDVAGCEEVILELHEVVEFLKEPERFYRLGGRIPKGVLLVGPPGTGKTLVARAVAGEADVPFFNLSGSDFVEMFVGVGAARVRDLFEQAQKLAPCIVFIDELDAIGKARGAGGPMSGNDEREQTLNALLVEMDGFDPKQSVIILAATNRPEILDPALLRPGRFDRQVLVDRPDIRGRLEILEVHAKGLVLGDDLDLEKIAAQTPGFVGADLANIVNEAALLAARRRKERVEQDDFQDAIERVIAGLEKKNRRMNAVEKQIVAYHEGGHAVAAAALPFADPVHKVSIIPRGIGALGYTLQVPLEDRYLMTQQELLDKIGGLLGGRAAESVIFGDVSTGAQNDLLRATDIARSMVMEYGMSDRLGAVHLGDTSPQTNFLAAAFSQRRQISNETAEAIDKEIQQIVERIRVKVIGILEANLDVLKAMARRLLETEVIDGEELDEMLARVVAIDEDKIRAQRYRNQNIDNNSAASGETENSGVESDGSDKLHLPPDREHSPSD